MRRWGHFARILGQFWVDLGPILGHSGVILDHLETILEAVDIKTQRRGLGYPFFDLIKRLREAKNIKKKNLGFLMILAFPPLDILSRQKTPRHLVDPLVLTPGGGVGGGVNPSPKGMKHIWTRFALDHLSPEGWWDS